MSRNIVNNKHAEIFTKKEQELLMNAYKKHIKSNALIMDYLNCYVDNPQTSYNELVTSECDPEILEFVKHNKEFTLAYLHFGIAKALADQDITDAHLMFVTSYIKSPTALAATNQMEMTMETQLMRESLLYPLWEKFTAPGGLKELIETDFHATYEAMANKDNGNS